MPHTVRAKFRCATRTTTQYGSDAPTQAYVTYEFSAVYDPNQPEDERYAKATPVGNLKMQVDNPAVVFEPGKSYYLDFTPTD